MHDNEFVNLYTYCTSSATTVKRTRQHNQGDSGKPSGLTGRPKVFDTRAFSTPSRGSCGIPSLDTRVSARCFLDRDGHTSGIDQSEVSKSNPSTSLCSQ